MNANLTAKTHYRTLRAIYATQTRPHEELLYLTEKRKIHTKHLQIPTIEVYEFPKHVHLSHRIISSKKQIKNI